MNFKKFIGIFVCITLIVSGIYYNQARVVTRNFEFTYSVIFKQTNGKKFEAWIPNPQTNEVQNISNVRIKTELDYKILDEEAHGNKYIYLYSSNILYISSFLKFSIVLLCVLFHCLFILKFISSLLFSIK